MRAGELRSRIDIEAATTEQNAFGEPVPTWTTFATVWAHREELPGTEQFNAGQQLSRTPTRFTLRYLDGVTPAMRVRSDSMAYEINNILFDGRRRSLTLIATRLD